MRCVTLKRVPLRHGEAGEFGRSVQKALDDMCADSYPVTVGEEELGHIMTFNASGGEPWSHLGTQHADLALVAQKITKGILSSLDEKGDMSFPCGMKTLDKLFEIGPGQDLIGHPRGGDGRGAFVMHPISGSGRADIEGSNRALWKADAKTQKSLCVVPTHKGTICNHEKAEKIKLTAGILHYSKGMRWTSQALMAAVTENKVLGGRSWGTLLHEDTHVCKAFALWANSTLGLLTHWTQGSRTQIGRAATQTRAIRAMPTPDLTELDTDALQVAASAFDELSSLLLMPACQSHDDPAREFIDEAVVKMLGLPTQRALVVLKTLREWWCAEPSVHGGNKEALDLLKKNNII